MKNRRKDSRLVIGAGLVLAGALPAWAQQDTGGLEEVVVTAERREANLQETPVTLTALSADQVADQGIVTTQDVAKTVPNLQLLPLTAHGLLLAHFALDGERPVQDAAPTDQPLTGAVRAVWCSPRFITARRPVE